MTDGRRRDRPAAGARPPAGRGTAASSRRPATRSGAKPTRAKAGSAKPTSARSSKAGAARSTGARSSKATAPRAGRARSGGTRTTGLRGTTPRAPARRRPRRGPPRRRVIRYRTRLLVGLAITAVVVPVLLLGLYPTRPYLAQRTATRQAEQELAELKEQNAELAEEADALMSSDEIEKRAREDHNYIRPGEEPFAVVPPSPPPVELPEVWPFTGADALLNG